MTILYVSDDYWIASRGYKLYKFDLHKERLNYFSRVIDIGNSILSNFPLTRRLFRAEITHLYRFDDDNWLCIAKKGIFRLKRETNKFYKCLTVKRGSRPMALCQDKNKVIYFGEYYANKFKKEVNIYKTEDNGYSWKIAYTFPAGSINHIHGLFKDLYSERLWVLTGDLDDESMIGYTEDGFKTFVPYLLGSQQFRACVTLFYKDKIVYATDSQYQPNAIKAIDRETGKIRDICSIQGSGIYGGQIGNLGFFSTTVEPSKVNKDKNSYLWISFDGEQWFQILNFEKDIYGKRLFQFGSIRFPVYDNLESISQLIITGRSLRKLDGHSLIIPIQIIRQVL